jgi:spore germination cell wall hydrolase CwlJ-like protein
MLLSKSEAAVAVYMLGLAVMAYRTEAAPREKPVPVYLGRAVTQIIPETTPRKPRAKKPLAAKVVALKTRYTAAEERLLRLTMWCEGRSTGRKGMTAVGNVALNRLASSRNFGSTLSAVLLKPYAFSCWNESDPGRNQMRNIAQLSHDSLDYDRWLETKKIAKGLLTGRIKDTTRGALFYHTRAVNPSWARGIKPIVRFATHLFYTVDRKAS